MHKNVKLLINEKGIFYNMWIFPNFPQNVDKIPNSKGPGPHTKKGCDGPAISLIEKKLWHFKFVVFLPFFGFFFLLRPVIFRLRRRNRRD